MGELEQIRNEFKEGGNPTKLMERMESIFKIPALNDEAYNEQHQEVIELYREIANARNL